MDLGTELTNVTFEQLGWQDVITASGSHESFDYCRAFLARAREFETSGNSVARQAFDLLAQASFAALGSGENNEPYLEEWLLAFTEEQLTIFRQLAPGVVDAEMRARLADIVWERSHDPAFGRLAVESYLKSARTLERADRWPDSFDRLERATNLARLLGKDAEPFRRAINHVEDVLNHHNGPDSSFFSAHLMELLQAHHQGDNLRYATFAEAAAMRATAEQEWDRARRYFFIEAEWYFRAGQSDIGTRARLRMLETHVLEADQIVSTSTSATRFYQASHHIERAIKGYQNFGGPAEKARRTELYLLLRRYQEKAQGELSSFDVPVAYDKAPALGALLTKQIVDRLKNKSIVEALRTLVSLPLLQDVAHVQEPAERFVRTSPVALLLPLVMHSSDGRVSGRPPSRPSNQEEQIEAEIRAHMFTNSNDRRIWRVSNLLLPAIAQVNSDHHIRMDDLKQIVVDNPFIPAGREYLFARGLHAGIGGDYLNSAHWLIPEIENSIRHVLTHHGAITSGFNGQDVQNQYDLNRILNNPELEKSLTKILGANLVFELKGLLVHHFGANLRNEIAHGTLGANEFSSDFYGLQLVYLWWLALRLSFTCVLPSNERSRTATA